MLEKLFSLLCKIFKRKNECFYINSNNLLPPPLEEEVERELLYKVQQGDNEARNTLIVHNLRLVVFIAKKFESTKINLEDLISIGSMGLIKGVQTFKMEKNIKLATYASRCIENEILMYLRKYANLKNELSIDEPLNVDWDGNELLLSDVLGTDSDEISNDIETEDERRLLRVLVNNLNEREREIMIMRFGLSGGEELTQKDVADRLGISQSYISRLEKRIIAKLKEEIEIYF